MFSAQKVTAQTAAVLKSTGGIAGVTAGQVDKLSKSLLNKSGVDDEAIKSGENMLLTFRRIRNEAGKGNDIFTQATKAVLDMDVAMTHGASTQESLSKTSILVGKALNDPIKGLTALQRVGVQFSASQRETIKGLVASGNVLGAQKVIIRELTKEFGGSAQALGVTLPGKISILRENVKNLGGDIAGILLPDIERIVDRGTKWIENSDNQKRVLKDVREGVHDASEVVRVGAATWNKFSNAVGGSKHALELLAGVAVGFKAVKLLDTITGIGVRARGSGREVNILRSRLLALGRLGVIGVTVAVGFEVGKAGQRFSRFLGGTGVGKALGIGDTAPAGVSPEDVVRLKQHLKSGAITKRDREVAAAFGISLPGASGLFEGLGELITKAIPHITAPTPIAAAAVGPKGLAALTARQRNDFKLKAAALTKSTADDLAALREQRALLAKAIQTERQRLSGATGREAQKYAENLGKLLDQDASAFSQITSIEDAAAAKARAEADRQKAARERRARAIKASIDAFAKDQAALRKSFGLKVPQLLAGAEASVSARVQRAQFIALGLGPAGTGQSPLKETLGHELGRVSAGLKGTLLDTNKNTHLLAQVGKVLDGQFGRLTDRTRAAVRKLLDTLDGELKKHKGFGPTGRVVTAESLTSGIGFSSLAAKRLEQARIAQALAHGGRIPTASSVQGVAVPQTVIVHHSTILDGRVLERSVTTHQQKRGRHRATQTSGINAGRGPA